MLSAKKQDNYFSEEMWSDPTIWYQVVIQNLSAETWDLIVDGAWDISQEKKSKLVMLNTKMPEADERELLAKGNEVVEDDKIIWDGCEWY